MKWWKQVDWAEEELTCSAVVAEGSAGSIDIAGMCGRPLGNPKSKQGLRTCVAWTHQSLDAGSPSTLPGRSMILVEPAPFCISIPRGLSYGLQLPILLGGGGMSSLFWKADLGSAPQSSTTIQGPQEEEDRWLTKHLRSGHESKQQRDQKERMYTLATFIYAI